MTQNAWVMNNRLMSDSNLRFHPSEIQQMNHLAREMGYCLDGSDAVMSLQAIAALLAGLTTANSENIDANIEFVAKVARQCFEMMGRQED